MIRIAVVEDEPDYAEQLRGFLGTYEQERGESILVSLFSDGDEIAVNYRPEYDIILLDVQMKFMDGMTAAEIIREHDSEVVIIFITNMAQYAIKGYAVDALDYVLKPVSYFALSQRLDRAIARLRKRAKKYITVAVRGGAQKLEVSQIHWVESQGHNLIFHTEAGDYVAVGTMKDVEERLEGLYFYRCNKGYLLNLEHVDGVRDGCALVNGEPLLISRSRKNDFLQALTNYMGEVMK